MNVNIEAMIGLAVTVLVGTGVLSNSLPSQTQNFNYNAATAEERAAFLEMAADKLSGTFKPTFVSKIEPHSFGGRSISFTYNVGTTSLQCDTDESCKVMQCRRYLTSPLSTQNISVKLKYESHLGSVVGRQTLKNSACETIVAKWDAKKS